DLGALGSDTRTRLDVPLARDHAGITVSVFCPASAGTVLFAAADDPGASLLSVSCTLGRATESFPAALPAGSYVLAIAVAGSGGFEVEVMGTPA
ncbi:MAG: hypothetical protein LC623_03045, partial [Halobacteriales archaeon]|nr:hypothetical protein [Halobacteriales archaeon]